MKAFVTLIGLMACVLCIGPLLAEESKEDWQPPPPMPEKHDWIQLTSGEWLKGEFIAMYDRELEFDSDELDLLTFDWEDVTQVRSARVMQVGFTGRVNAIGKLHIEGDKVLVIGDEVQEFERSRILTITVGSPRERSHWVGKVSIGATVRQGNVDQVDSNVKANFKRRTIKNRLVLDYIANYGVTEVDVGNQVEDQEVANNQRVSITWDRFLRERFFVKPVLFEFFRDPFQNIGARTTLGVGAGFQLIDTPKTDWEVSGGPGYQETRFDTVQPGEEDSDSTGVLTVGSIFDQEWSKSVDFKFEYRLQITNEESGEFNHHLVMSFETEWTKVLDFDLTFVWDRIEKPRVDEDGNVPEQNDFRMVIGLGIEF